MERPITAILLGSIPPLEEVASDLEQAGVGVCRVLDAGPELRAALQHGDRPVLLLLPGTVRAVREMLSPDGLPSDRPRPALLALCPTAGTTPAELERAREEADDALYWPEGRQHLVARLTALALNQAAVREARLRRVHARTIQEVASLLATTLDLQIILHDVMGRLVDSLEMARAIILTIQREENRMSLVADSEEDVAGSHPVSPADFPEVVEMMRRGGEILLPLQQDDPEGRLEQIAAALRQRAVQAMLVVPLVWYEDIQGALELWGEPGSAFFEEPTRDMIREVAALVAQAMCNSDLVTSLTESTKVTRLALPPDAGTPVLARYKDYFQRAFDGIIVLNKDDQVMHINPAGEQITGYARRGLVGTALGHIVVERDRLMVTDLLEQVRQHGSSRSFDLGLITTSGDPILVSVAPSAVLAEEELVILSFRDVTEARALENELRSTKDFLERLIDSTVDAIVVADINGTIILFNSGAERLFGRRASEVVGKVAFAQLFPANGADKVMGLLYCAEQGEPGRIELLRTEVLHAQQRKVPVSLSASLLHEEKEVTGMVVLISDMTEQAMMEQRLAQAQERLIEGEKQALIAELAGTTAHELNQPLTSIMGYAELLKRRLPEDDSNLRALNIILREAERMAEIVRKIGRITRYETKSYVGSAQILDLEKSSE